MNRIFKSLSIFAAAFAVFSCTPEAAEAVITILAGAEFTIPADGGSAEFDFESDQPWSTSILHDPSMTDVSWFTVAGMNGEAGKGHVKVTAAPNPGESPRSLEVVIKAGSSKSAPVLITQLGKASPEIPGGPQGSEHVDNAIKVAAYDVTAKSAYFKAEFAGSDPEGSYRKNYGIMYSAEYKTPEDIFEHGIWLDPLKYKTTGDEANVYRTYTCNLTEATTYYVIACAEYISDTKTFRSSPVYTFSSAVVETNLNGHDAVDLGLSVKWAKCNVGAKDELSVGSYFSWGETAPKSTYDRSHYVFYGGMFPANPSWVTFTKYVTFPNNAAKDAIDNLIALQPSDDAAHAVMGGTWRIPHESEFKELVKNCKWERISDPTSASGAIKGVKVTGPNGNSITLPFTGNVSGSADNIYFPDQACYLGAEVYTADNSLVWMLNVTSGSQNVVSSCSRVGGIAIRAVTD